MLLPNVQAIAVTLFGLNAFGRVPAFLNFTAGLKNLKAACDLAGMRTIVTSRRFVEQGKLDDVVEALGEGRRILWLEDVRGDLTSIDKLRGLFDSWFARRVHARARLQPDDPAVLLFTSGSEGVPKGVVLSNANLVANAYQVKALAGDVLRDDDVFFNPLPIFHSFGLTAGLSDGGPQRHEDRCSIRARSITGRSRSSWPARAPRSCSRRTPSCRAMRAPPARTIWRASAMSSPGRSG